MDVVVLDNCPELIRASTRMRLAVMGEPDVAVLLDSTEEVTPLGFGHRFGPDTPTEPLIPFPGFPRYVLLTAHGHKGASLLLGCWFTAGFGTRRSQ